ncbi:hypothetical protein FY036_03470 [Mesorhizobium microcysteis]|uniref:Uncharacterized protein n=1 Tax=Neoaquamicrobium microcysteis TaxID=2682781 RepID=A0A5D4H3R3_9HYPH|nr:hypothetical protein [Mesorhizobium microcysteis]TYR34893.1 hypothetical protein FY036_03470 [Mesorhizobium microcysteis]
MATCNVCAGYGWTYGDYPPCYSCGGSGTGGFTHIACAACGGSGRGSSRQQNTCIGCGGSGTIPGTESWAASSSTAARSAPAAPSRRKPAPPPRPWTRNELYALVPAFGVSAAALHAYMEVAGWWLASAIIPAIIVVRAWKFLLALAIVAAGLWIAADRL